MLTQHQKKVCITNNPDQKLKKTIKIDDLTVKPASTAFLAKSPAPSITLGLLVLVQEVMAAITTLPWPILYCFPSNINLALALNLSSGMPNPLNPTCDKKSD